MKAATEGGRFSFLLINMMLNSVALIIYRLLFRFCIFLCLLIGIQSYAGIINFQITYYNTGIIIKNTGEESVYGLNIYLVNKSLSWEKLKLKDKTNDMLSPGDSFDFHLRSSPVSNIISYYEPTFIIGRDQAGGKFSQLSWRISPSVYDGVTKYNYKSDFLYLEKIDAELFKSYIINNPNEGINELAFPITQLNSPPAVQVHEWSGKEKFLKIDAGSAHSGAWILNERKNSKELMLQIIRDGKYRGEDQTPVFLKYTRNFGFIISLLVGAFGSLIFLYSLVKIKK